MENCYGGGIHTREPQGPLLLWDPEGQTPSKRGKDRGLRKPDPFPLSRVICRLNCMRHASTEELFLVHLKFRFTLLSCIFFFFFIFIVLRGVHCGIYKGSYNVSNISYCPVISFANSSNPTVSQLDQQNLGEAEQEDQEDP
jgi:hypothetical protein